MFAEAHINELKTAVRERKLIIVAGAGVSKDAGLPLWTELLQERMPVFLESRGPQGKETAELLRTVAARFPLQAADIWWNWLYAQEGRAPISHFFEETFLKEKKPTRTHEQIVELCRLSSSGVVTTNFDCLFEAHAPDLRVRTQADSDLGLLLKPGGIKFLFKLHGTADKVETVVLTATQYGQQSLREAYKALFSAIQIQHALLFVGYGGRDPDLDHLRKQLVSRFSGNIPNIYMLLDRPDGVLCETLRRDRVIVAEFDGQRDGYGVINRLLEELLAEGRALQKRSVIAPAKGTGTKGKMPPEYIAALKQELKRASLIDSLTKGVIRRPEIESVYVPVQIDRTVDRRLEMDKPETDGARPKSLREVWDEWRPAEGGPMVVLGRPGAGKSTLLKHVGLLALDAAEGKESIGGKDLTIAPGTVPVFIRLTKLGDLTPGIPNLIAGCPPQVDLQLSPALFKDWLDSGDCLLLLDGLDEAVNQERTVELSRWAERIHHAFKQCRIVITSRDRGYREGAMLRLPHHCVSLAPLGDDDILVFLQKWYGSLEAAMGGEPAHARQLAEKLRNLLLSPERKDLRSLAGTPLLLLIMALIHRSGKGLPDRRVELYDAFIRILLEDWNKENDRAIIPANPARAVLRPLAFWFHSQAGRYSATIGELEPVIRPDLERTPQLKYDSPSEFLESVRDLSGLLVGESQDDYAFLHPTFQEFLAAEHVKTEPGELPRFKQGRRR